MNVPLTTRAAEGLPRRAFTIADVERMVEVGLIAPDERLEIIGGEIVPMSPKGNRHESVKSAITMLWGRRCPEDFVFAQETGLRLDKDTYLEPDFIVFARSTALKDVRGPDVLLAVEVADSSLDYDLGRKQRVYAEYGARELWVIDAARRVVHFHRGPHPEGYAEKAVHGADERLEPAFAPRDFAFALDDLPEI